MVRAKLVTGAVSLLLLLAACGAEEPPEITGGRAEPTAPAEGEGAGKDAQEQADFTVTAFDFRFEPDSLSVDSGESVGVSFKNSGGVTHTFTSEELGFDQRLDSGATALVAFDAPTKDGSYGFRCTIHPDQMQGTIIVGSGGDNPPETGEGAGENDTGQDAGGSDGDASGEGAENDTGYDLDS